MLKPQLIDDFVAKLREFLIRIGGSVRNIQKEPVRPGPDLVVQAEIRSAPITLIVEVKSQGEPRYVRQAADQLREYGTQFPGAYPIVVSNFISPQAEEILKAREIGYFDMAGNVLIDFGSLFINVVGKPNRNPVQKRLNSFFADKSSRILRVLLTAPERSWTVQDLSAEAGISIGLTSRVKQRLIDFELIPETKGAFGLTNPGELLEQWSNAYSYEKNEITKYYSSSHLQEIEKRVATFAAPRKIPYQLTMFSGAARVAPFIRDSFAAFYFSGSLPELERELALSSTASGANVWVLRPFDEGIYYGKQKRDEISIASNVQLYLDLISLGAGDQATAIRERLLRY